MRSDKGEGRDEGRCEGRGERDGEGKGKIKETGKGCRGGQSQR